MKPTPHKSFLARLLDDWMVDIGAAVVLAGGLLVMWKGG